MKNNEEELDMVVMEHPECGTKFLIDQEEALELLKADKGICPRCDDNDRAIPVNDETGYFEYTAIIDEEELE
jgi:hypothetical protein